jgi:hypothetical protein
LTNLSFAYLTAYLFNFVIHHSVKKNLTLILSSFFVLSWTLVVLTFSSHSTANLSTIGLKNSLYAFIFQLILIFLLSIILFLTKKTHIYLVLLVVALLTFGELGYYGLKYLPFSESKYLFPTTPSIDFLIKNSGQYRIATADTIPENMWMPYGLKSADGYDTLVPMLNYQLLSFVQDGKYSSAANRAKKLSNFNSPLFNLTSVKYLLKQNQYSQILPTEFDKTKFKLVGQDGLVSIVENLQARSRVYFSANTITSKLNLTNPNLLSELDQSKNIIFSNSPLDLSAINACQDNTASAQIITDKPNHLTINTTNKCPAILILQDAFYPGWQATIDNQPVNIYQSNIAFRSLITPPGSHQIDFNFLPRFFYPTLIISAISLLLAILFIFL